MWSLGTILALRIFGGGLSPPISWWVFSSAFLNPCPCSQMPPIPVGVPLYGTTTCQACGIAIAPAFSSTTGNFWRCFTWFRVFFLFSGVVWCLFSDNTTALSYIHKQGGAHSPALSAVAQSILRLCKSHQIWLLPQFIPVGLIVLADSLSCQSQVLGSGWTLCHQVLWEVLHRWPVTIDLFVTNLNHRLPVYFSPMADPQSAGTDTMMQSWDGLQAYAFPPFSLLRVISKVRQSRGLDLTLVAPLWPQHP